MKIVQTLIFIFTILFLTFSCSSHKEAVQVSAKNDTQKIVSQPQVPEPPEPPIVSNPNHEPELVVEEAISHETQDEEITIKIDSTFNHNLFDSVLKTYVSSKGNVDYKSLKNNPENLRVYIKSLGTHLPNELWSKNDKLAFWINAYNAMTIDLIIRNYPVKSIKDIKDPWDQRLWKLGSKWYNLNEIEHQILRKMNEPRIHFAIVCASFSCPKLENTAYNGSELETQLNTVTKSFLSDGTKNNISQNTLELSKIFKWFAKDFKENGSLIDFLNSYTDVEISDSAKKSYKDYNWDLNEN
ncbi:DUF547 domain-containing protein [uncultured Psychroserpens sp.]|uniref:DUF547 domain-containing protein n=1 Tax=uncultured Psychroserpens sp. TaxID=255436 RepID=UPI00262D6D92|nr:DUF547 domain-containing protein [uncultured Psychroserpens sp.]